MEKWLHENLSRILKFSVPDILVQSIMQIQNERDLDKYLSTLLNCNEPTTKQFIADLKKRQASNIDRTGYKKVNDSSTENKKQNEKKKGKAKAKEKQEYKQPQEIVKVVEKHEKKKTKFVNLYSQEGKDRTTVLLKGRHKCNCEAQKHSLINNCLNCGRIVCAQEGAGPCFCCGELVCSPKEQTILSSNTKVADNLYNKLMNQKPSKSLEDSVKLRDKLLEYDREGTQGTKVIDDECDYYQSNSVWLTSMEREQVQKWEEKLQAKKHESRLNRKVNVTFDFTGREVIEENTVDVFNEFMEEQFQDISGSVSYNGLKSSNTCPDIEFTCPTYIESNAPEPRGTNAGVRTNTKNIIQDKEYLEMSDAGLCLSMHQPYASLLVSGIKMHEGRTWYTSHRGRLWIASTVKPAAMEEISRIQHSYRVLKNEKIKFPENYPNGCLLGCVTVVDVLPQEEYRKIYPDGESDSPYVFICENFHTLPIKFPIKGMHKIYKLDQKIHQAALKLLEKHTKNTHI